MGVAPLLLKVKIYREFRFLLWVTSPIHRFIIAYIGKFVNNKTSIHLIKRFTNYSPLRSTELITSLCTTFFQGQGEG